MAGHTENIRNHKPQKSEGSHVHISSYLFGKDLGDYQSNLLKKKERKTKAVAKKLHEYDLPMVKKLITSKAKATISTSQDWYSFHFTCFHLNSYQVNNDLSLSSTASWKTHYSQTPKGTFL